MAVLKDKIFFLCVFAVSFLRCAAEIMKDFIPTCRRDGDMSVGVREINLSEENKLLKLNFFKNHLWNDKKSTFMSGEIAP